MSGELEGLGMRIIRFAGSHGIARTIISFSSHGVGRGSKRRATIGSGRRMVCENCTRVPDFGQMSLLLA